MTFLHWDEPFYIFHVISMQIIRQLKKPELKVTLYKQN